jgi:hypothetical protein
MTSSRIGHILIPLLAATAIAGCASGRIPPQPHPVVDHALIIHGLDETERLVERFFTMRGSAVERRKGLFRHGRPAALVTASNSVTFTIRSIALPERPPTEMPEKLGCDCGTVQENILIDKDGYFDNFTIVRQISIEEVDSATSLVTLDFRYDASYYRPGGFFDSKVQCQSTGAIEAELFAWLMAPEEGS